MPDQFDLENRLHQLSKSLEDLRAYWSEYIAYVGISDSEVNQVIREFKHKFLEITGEIYVDGILSVDAGYFRFDSTLFRFDTDTATFDQL